MGALLITAAYGKEAKARLEALDCIFPVDPGARCPPLPYGGLLLLETGLASDEAAALIGACGTSLIFKIVPIDSITESDLEKIRSEVLRLLPEHARRVAVDCHRRGRVLPSSHAVEEAIGRAVAARGSTIDLRSPELVIRIDIIGRITTISVRHPSGIIDKKGGRAHG